MYFYTMLSVSLYLVAGLIMCLQLHTSFWWAPLAPAVTIVGILWCVGKVLFMLIRGRFLDADVLLYERIIGDDFKHLVDRASHRIGKGR